MATLESPRVSGPQIRFDHDSPGIGECLSDVSVVIPSYGRPESIVRCIAALRSGEPSVHEIVVADTPKALDYASDAIGSGLAKIVRLPAGTSIARARNEGARVSEGRYIFFLDDDNVVSTQTILLLRRVLDENPGIGIAGPVSYYLAEPTKVWSAGVKKSRVLRRHIAVYPSPRMGANFLDVDIIPNAFMIERSRFNALGGFDEANFTIQEEETDLQWRCRERGFRTVIVPGARTHHDISADGLGHMSITILEEAARARLRIEVIHRGGIPLGMLVMVPISVIYYILQFSHEGRYRQLVGPLEVAKAVLRGTARAIRPGWKPP